MPAHPVLFDCERPATFQRVHVFLRIAILLALSLVTAHIGLYGLLYLAFPLLAAILISQKGSARFVMEDGPRITSWLGWLAAFLAYIAQLTDRLPGDEPTVRFEIRRSGSPTVGSALLRILYGIPHAIVLAVLGIVFWIFWIVAAIAILIGESYPESLYSFQRGIVRWEMRLLAYLASLVEPYPPFGFR
jgi:hypothetical protein